MQFPRGRFAAFKKEIRICDLLEELKQSRFSGYCIITRGMETSSLVLKNGNCLLAGYQELIGDDAWISIRRIGESEVDAQLMHLSPAQLTLTLEFNPGACIERKRKSNHGEKPGDVPVNNAREERKSPARIPKPRTSRDSPERETGAGALHLTGQATGVESHPAKAGTHPEEGQPAEPAHSGEAAPVRPDQTTPPGSDIRTGISPGHQDDSGPVPAPPGDLTPVPPEKPAPGTGLAREHAVPPVSGEPRAEQGPEGRSALQDTHSSARETPEGKSANEGFLRELAALDAMDLQSMTEKIRNNCRVIIQGLHLEHLLDQRAEEPK